MTKLSLAICYSFYVALLLPALAYADRVNTQADLLFNWAEANFPNIFSHSLTSQTFLEYYYRGPYTQPSSNAQLYLGVTLTADPHVVLLDTSNQVSDTGIIDLGPMDDWLSIAGYTNPGQSSGCGLSVTTGHRYESILSSGKQRKYYLSVPENYDPNKSYGLVFGYHGRDYDGKRMRDYLNLEDTPQANDALFVYPDGLNRYWEEFRSSAIGWFLNPYDNQDFILFDDILTEMENHFCIDTKRVYVTGQSWGGDMTSALACARGSKIAAAVAVGVNGDFFFTGRSDFPALYPILAYSNCQRPVPMITYRGEDDTLKGGESSDWWYGVNQCQQPAGNAVKENIKRNGYYEDKGCLVPNIFVRYSNGGGSWNDHQIPDKFEYGTMDFFQQHALP